MNFLSCIDPIYFKKVQVVPLFLNHKKDFEVTAVTKKSAIGNAIIRQNKI